MPFSTGLCVHPKSGSQESVVHVLLSLQLSTVPAVHTPSWQVSSPLQTSPSVHDEPSRSGVLTQPLMALQVSVVQTLLSLQVSGVPETQEAAWQVSLPLQTVPSPHEVPSATAVLVHPATGSHVSVVQTLASLQLRGVPEVQVPL
jgi:hypothetical protein